MVTRPGEIDAANADQVHHELLAAFVRGVGIVIADMSGTRFRDSSHIHALVMAYKRAKLRRAIPDSG